MENSREESTSSESLKQREPQDAKAPLYEDLPKMGNNRDYPPHVSDRDKYMVTFDGDNDPSEPINFPNKHKQAILFAGMLTCFTSTLGSAIFSSAVAEISKEFKVGLEVSTLSTSLFVIGYASGPVVWGPLCELYGRKVLLIPSVFLYTCFNFAVATAKDVQTLIICRFFAGFAGAAPMVIVPAMLADLLSHKARGMAVNCFAMVVFGGPMLAPIIGSFTVKNQTLGWRWCSYFTGILSSSSLVTSVIFMKETHRGVILSNKARHIRNITGNGVIYSAHEDASISINDILSKALSRPLIMLAQEPILLAMTIYNAFVYGLLYLLLTAIPVIFGQGYKFSEGVSELPYLAMFIGVQIGGIINILFEVKYTRTIAEKGRPPAESKLPPMMIGAIAFPCGLFWLSWSGQYPDKVHWIVPTIGTVPVGIGLMCIFMPSINYIIECYLQLTASAMAGNTLIRAGFGGAFPLFSRQMYNTLHVNWAGSLLGFFALILVPVPFLFFKYGKWLRQKSKFAPKV